MRLTNAIVALVLLCTEASAHRHGLRRRAHSHFTRHAQLSAKIEQLNVEHAGVEKRGSTCSLPDHSDLVRVPGDKNGGFAMSPDQACEDGMYCPIACKPGMVMAQWKADTTYEYPDSMDGGLYCDGGKAKKPFEDSPYCVDGTGTVKAVNKCGKKVSFCQTVLPGNEAMLIPTVVDDSKTLAVPDPSYWDSTAAHYYINPPGTGDEGCIWGDSSKPVGNWAPYVAGANTDGDGQTFIKLGFNPIFEFEGDGLKKSLDFGVRIECPDGGCNGLPCELNPAKETYGEVVSDQSASGAGGSSFCVVTVPSGSKANVVVFNVDGSESGGDEDDEDDDKDKDDEEDKDDDDDDDEPTSTSKPSSSSSEAPKSTSSSSSSSSRPTVGPGIFREQSDDEDDDETSSANVSASSSSSESSSSSDASQTEDENDSEEDEEGDEPNNAPSRQSNAAIGLVVAVAVAACFY